ncbi:Salicylate hydroxylase [Cytospora mali]|uniref:Salicylate hydroxylase n=1 Tax=Cytospora mali TaxID=578113 RepID=A0A194VJJ5_CYTMA|nr:Salicylate hydroxylase [Valsa mali]
MPSRIPFWSPPLPDGSTPPAAPAHTHTHILDPTTYCSTFTTAVAIQLLQCLLEFSIATVRCSGDQRGVKRTGFLDELIKHVPDGVAKFDKRVTHYTEDKEGKVTLHIKNGSTDVYYHKLSLQRSFWDV